MPTRPPSSSALGLALGLALAAPHATAQTADAEERAIRARLGLAHPAPAGVLHAGVHLAAVRVPGLQLRARVDRGAAEGGIALAFGTDSTTLRVRIAVAPDAATARDALVRALRTTQARPEALADPLGADEALGHPRTGAHAAAARWGNITVVVQRTGDAGPETPAAATVLALVRAAFGPAGAPAMPACRLAVTPAAPGQPTAVQVLGASFEQVRAVVTGGYLRGAPGPRGFELVADGEVEARVQVVATDALGRVATASAVVAPRP